jgi:hypothetical protein
LTTGMTTSSTSAAVDDAASLKLTLFVPLSRTKPQKRRK